MTDISNNDTNRFRLQGHDSARTAGSSNKDKKEESSSNVPEEQGEEIVSSLQNPAYVNPDAILNTLGLMSQSQKLMFQGQAKTNRSLQEFNQTFQNILGIIESEIPDRFLSPEGRELLALRVLERRFM